MTRQPREYRSGQTNWVHCSGEKCGVTILMMQNLKLVNKFVLSPLEEGKTGKITGLRKELTCFLKRFKFTK